MKYSNEKMYFNLEDIKLENIVVGEPQTISPSKSDVKSKNYSNIPIGYKLDSKKDIFYLRLTTPETLKFGGIQTNSTSYSLPCNLFRQSMEKASEKETAWIKKWEEICEKIGELTMKHKIPEEITHVANRMKKCKSLVATPYTKSGNDFTEEAIPTIWIKVGTNRFEKNVNAKELGIYAKFIDMRSYYNSNNSQTNLITFDPCDMLKRPFIGMCGIKIPSATLGADSFNLKVYLETALIDEFLEPNKKINLPKNKFKYIGKDANPLEEESSSRKMT